MIDRIDATGDSAPRGRQTKEERLAAIHAEALEEFDDIQSAVRDERMQCLEDRRFYSISGAQWEGPLGEQFENKPRFELNKTHLSVIRIINEYRNNRVTVDFLSKDGTPNDECAETCDGLYRADEQASVAEEAYDNGFEEAVGGGFGAFRLRACYEDEDDDENEKQRISIEPIFDADSCVFFDLNAKRQDKSDAKRCYVLTSMSEDAYKEEWGDDPTTWPREIRQSQFDWAVGKSVYVAELYRVEESTELIHYFRGLDENAEDMRVPDSEMKDDPQKEAELQATGFREIRQKRVKRQRVHKYIMSGSKILSDEGYIAGKHIPIVPVYGKRWLVDGVERCMGHVRLAKDAQRLTNLLMSWLAEMAARFDTEKPIFVPEQMAGHATMWANDNVSKFPYLLVNSITGTDGSKLPAGPVGYTKAPNLPPAMAALSQIAEQALQDLLGNQQAGEQLQPNLSGKAVELIQQRLDMQVFIYMSNFAKSMRRAGQIWLSMAKELFVEESRKMKIIAADGTPAGVEINKPAYDAETGQQIKQNDITQATFDVWADVGPSSSSQRSATVRALTGIAQITDDPETKQALTLATIANLEGEGLNDLREWARAKAIRLGILKPNEEEKKEMAAEQANQQPDAQAQYLLSAAQQAEADAALGRAKTVQTIADADLKRATTLKTLAETTGEHQAHQIDAFRTLHEAAASQQEQAAPTPAQ